MAAREIIVKKYVVRLGGEEREQLVALTRKGRGPAQRLMKARILLKADASEAGEGWSDNQIIEALETSASMVYRVRKQLVEEGLEAVLSRKPRAAPAVPKIFDGEKEAKLIALACSEPPKGRARWTLRLLEHKVVELNCKSLNLSFQSLSREIATRHSSHDGEFGERIDSVNRDRGASRDAAPPTPPGIRVRTMAVRRIKHPPAFPSAADRDDGSVLW